MEPFEGCMERVGTWVTGSIEGQRITQPWTFWIFFAVALRSRSAIAEAVHKNSREGEICWCSASCGFLLCLCLQRCWDCNGRGVGLIKSLSGRGKGVGKLEFRSPCENWSNGWIWAELSLWRARWWAHQSSTKPMRSKAMDELEGAAICMGEK